jgi:hypothetical protein
VAYTQRAPQALEKEKDRNRKKRKAEKKEILS